MPRYVIYEHLLFAVLVTHKYMKQVVVSFH